MNDDCVLAENEERNNNGNKSCNSVQMGGEGPNSNEEESGDNNGKELQLFSAAAEEDPSSGEFDPHNFGNEKNATSFCGTVMHMIIVSMSPTLLNLPEVFHNVGYTVGAVGSFITVILYAYCMHMLVDCEYTLCKRLRRPNMTYTELLYYAFATGPKKIRWLAKPLKRLIYCDFVFMWGGGNAIYVILICQNLGLAVKYFAGVELSDRTLIMYITLPLVLLCWIPNLKFLVSCSIFSNVVNTFTIAVILFFVLQNMPSVQERRSMGDMTRIPYFLGVIFVTVDGTALLMSLKNQMKKPKKFKSKFGVLNVSYVPTGILYAVFGLLCYVKFGDEAEENILKNLENTSFVNAVRFLYALSVVCFYPLCSFVSFDIIWNEQLKRKLRPGMRRTFCGYLVKTANALGSIVLAFILPDISVFISFTGTICTSFHSIILPALTEILVYYPEKSNRGFLMKNAILVIVGVSLAVAGMVDSYFGLVRYYSESNTV